MGFAICTATEHRSGDRIKEDEMAGAGGICAGEMHREFWWGNLKKYPGLDEIYLTYNFIYGLCFVC
jgi:hypothetical protein